MEFDRLVLACPLDDALGFLDASEEERDLYSRILHKDYRVYLKRARGLRVPAGFAPARLRPLRDRQGHDLGREGARQRDPFLLRPGGRSPDRSGDRGRAGRGHPRHGRGARGDGLRGSAGSTTPTFRAWTTGPAGTIGSRPSRASTGPMSAGRSPRSPPWSG
ncbi:MAG: hypothetical protein MZV70_06120 [Desulfobacterales bacterium]|nr:hypothetical protein [Desulfobacterales bacterium]